MKGVAFHPSKPWVITSLHSGAIQIWDYNMKLCVAKFEVRIRVRRATTGQFAASTFTRSSPSSFQAAMTGS